MNKIVDSLKENQKEVFILEERNDYIQAQLLCEEAKQAGLVDNLRVMLLKYWYEPAIGEVAIESGMFSDFKRTMMCLQDLHTLSGYESKQAHIKKLVGHLIEYGNIIVIQLSRNEEIAKSEKTLIHSLFPKAVYLSKD